MEIVGPFIQELLAIAGYALVFAGVYKLFQVAGDIREIKDVIKNAQRSGSHFSTAALAPGETDNSLDSANSYAESLLRAVSAQSHGANEPVESSGPRP